GAAGRTVPARLGGDGVMGAGHCLLVVGGWKSARHASTNPASAGGRGRSSASANSNKRARLSNDEDGRLPCPLGGVNPPMIRSFPTPSCGERAVEPQSARRH